MAEKETLFVFSSSTGGKWQNGDEIAMALAQQGYKILMLTKKSYSHKNIISMFVPYNEVPHYLMAADIGIIVRDDNTVNKVSSPIKFSEYLSCGLPVIANDSVKLISDVLKNYNCGAIVNDLKQLDPNTINNLLSMDRERNSDIGKELFSIEKIADGYIGTYNLMASAK
ncbi:MAG: glycosyltransferase [Sulfurovaceae bacterium]